MKDEAKMVDYWIKKLDVMKDYRLVDMLTVNAALAEALSAEVKPITHKKLNDLWFDVIDDPEYEQHCIIHEGKLVFGVPLLFLRWTDFVAAIGQSFGFMKSADDVQDASSWIKDSMPNTKAIMGAMREITVNALSKASDVQEERTGVSAAEVLIQTLSTGESPEQTAARLQHAARGLRLVD